MKKRFLGVFAVCGLALALGSCDANKATDNENNTDSTTETDSNKENTPTTVALAAPTLTVSDKTVSWAAVANAENYIVNLNGTDLEAQATLSYTLTETANGDYVIKVKAITSIDGYTNGDYSSSVTITIAEPEKEKIATPDVAKKDYRVYWEAVTNASSYIVNVDGTDLEAQTATYYDLGANGTAGDHTIKVKAVSGNDNYGNSDYSSSVSITLEAYEAPTGLAQVTLWVVGDSTLSPFTDAYYLPRQGYGTQLDEYLSSNVTVKNLALSGRSARTFLSETNYTTLTSGIKSGDYLMIGFGHNDEKDDDSSRYAAPTLDAKDTEKTGNYYNFQYILNEYYLKVATAAGATPILCTPIVRLNANNDYTGSSGHITSKGDYPACIKDLGEDTGTTVIDLTTLTKNHYTSVGYDVAKYYHAVTSCMYDANGQLVPNFNTVDKTHINYYGAHEVCYLLTNALKNTTNGLGKYVKPYNSQPIEQIEYLDAINEYAQVPTYQPIDWSKYEPADNYSMTTTGELKYNDTKVGYGWCGTIFGNVGGTGKKWYATETTTGNYKVGQSATENSGSAAGKISSDNEGFAFLFSQIDVNYNFTVSATLTVAEQANTSQAGFGIMLRDDCYTPNKDTSIVSNSVSAGLYCASTSKVTVNWSRENGTLKQASNSLSALYTTDDTAQITVKRLGQVVTCTTVYKGQTYTTTYTDFDFVAIDNYYMYVGIFATRGTIVTTSDLTITIDGVSQGA